MTPAIELTAFRGQPVWEFLAAQYLVMIQAGAFAMLAGSVVQVLRVKPLPGLRLWGSVAGACLAVSAPLNLIAEMLAPWRFPTMLWRFNPSSPLSWGVAAIAAFTLLGLVRVYGLVRGGALGGAWMAALAGLCALGVLGYTWAEVALASGVPMWAHPAAAPVLFGSALAAGLALCLWLARLGGEPPLPAEPAKASRAVPKVEPGTVEPGAAEPAQPAAESPTDRTDAPAPTDRAAAKAQAAPTIHAASKPQTMAAARVLCGLAGVGSGLGLLCWGFLGGWPVMPGWWQGTLMLVGAGVGLFVGGALFWRPGRAASGVGALLCVLGALGARLGVTLAGQAQALGRNIGEPQLLGHVPWLTAAAPAALCIFLLLAASLALGGDAPPKAAPPAGERP